MLESQPAGSLGELPTRETPKEAFAGLVTAPVFKTGEVSETMPGGFDSHPLPFSQPARRRMSNAEHSELGAVTRLEAGELFANTGHRRPASRWPETGEALTGHRRVDGRRLETRDQTDSNSGSCESPAIARSLSIARRSS